MALFAGSARALQSVHVVNGGVGSALQTAIDGAADGDTVLVHGGNFSAIQIVGKSLTLVSEPELSTTVAGIHVLGTNLTQRTTIAGLKVVAPAVASSIAPDCIRVDQCAGSVRLERLDARLIAPNGNAALSATQCSDLAIFHCSLSGSDGAASTQWLAAVFPGAGIESVRSRIAAFDSTIRGGKGMDGFVASGCSYTWFNTPGGAGIELDAGSHWFASACALIAGAGGRGVNAYCSCSFGQLVPGTVGAAGGAAIANHAAATADLIGVTLAGGTGGGGGAAANCGGGPGGSAAPGAAGPSSTNMVHVLPGAALRLAAPSVVRAGQTLVCDITGTPGDLVLLRRSPEAGFVNMPLFQGVLLTDLRAPRIAGGFVPTGGQLQLSAAAGALPIGVESTAWHVQLLGRGPAGALQLGGAFVVTVLDPSF